MQCVLLRAVPGHLWGLLVVALALLAGCAPSDQEIDFLARKAYLERQSRGLRELLAEAEQGSLVPKDRFLIGISEALVSDLFRYQLPMERPLGEHLIVHLDSASVLLRDKFGFITLDGYVHRRATPERHIAVRIYGGLGDIAIDPATQKLKVSVAIDRLELREAGILDRVLGPGGRKFISERGRDLLQDALPPFEIPVAMAQNIKVPALQEGAIALDSLVVPLDMSVGRVIAAGGKLWVTVDAKIGRVTGAEDGLGVTVKKKKKPRPSSAKGTT